MSELFNKQSLFSTMVAKLIQEAVHRGYDVTLGDAFRDPRLHGELGVKLGYGHSKSCHKIRLAIDLNLFKDGKFLQTTEDHQKLGEYWESLGGSWGGRFNDANHYSFEYEGMR